MPALLSRLETSSLISNQRSGIPAFAALGVVGFAICFSTANGAFAQQDACEQFNWPVKREQAAFAASDLTSVQSGAKLDALPELGIIIALKPNAEVNFAVPPGRQPKNATSSGGVITIANVPKAGSYQVTSSAEGWIDVIQDGKALPASDHTGRRDCADVRKSVRFALQPGELTLQLSGVDSKSVKIAILPAE